MVNVISGVKSEDKVQEIQAVVVTSEDEVTETQTDIIEEVEEVQAVVTRAQAQNEKEEKKSKPLTVSDSVDVGVGKEQLISSQEQDKTLKKLFEKAQKAEHKKNSDSEFGLKSNILYRHWKSHEGKTVTKVVLPHSLREKVMKLAHDTVMSGHQGCNKTKDRIWSNFWWPGMGCQEILQIL